jgi:hypothetical protein
VALAKRVLSLIGKSNYPSVRFIYFNVGTYRSHVREYTVSELEYVLKQSGITGLKSELTNSATKSLICENRGLRKASLKLYDLISTIVPNLRDTILIFGRKPENWKPLDDLIAFKNLKNHYDHLVKYNLDSEDDDNIVSKIRNEVYT